MKRSIFSASLIRPVRSDSAGSDARTSNGKKQSSHQADAGGVDAPSTIEKKVENRTADEKRVLPTGQQDHTGRRLVMQKDLSHDGKLKKRTTRKESSADAGSRDRDPYDANDTGARPTPAAHVAMTEPVIPREVDWMLKMRSSPSHAVRVESSAKIGGARNDNNSRNDSNNNNAAAQDAHDGGMERIPYLALASMAEKYKPKSRKSRKSGMPLTRPTSRTECERRCGAACDPSNERGCRGALCGWCK